jgi:plasmid stabilization system protein ParE
MDHRIAPRAARDLDNIWLYVARDSGSVEVANKLIGAITDQFLLLARYPRLGRARDDDLRNWVTEPDSGRISHRLLRRG